MSTRNPVSVVLLRSLSLFEAVPEESLQILANASSLLQVPRNTVILHAGDHTDNLYVILSGSLRVQVSDEEGREVILNMLHPGEFFGEMGMIDGQIRSATVQAIEPVSLVVISKADFQHCLSQNFEVSLHIMRSLVKRLREADRRIESLALMDVYGRVARLMLDMAEEHEGRMRVSQKLSGQDIAKMVGASREMVSRVMKNLQIDGLIEKADGYFLLGRTEQSDRSANDE
jgi:CRP/FNR family cyclic AMP-dependent transcriptional regulator